MQAIDLVYYAHSRKKIPKEILTKDAEVYPSMKKSMFYSYLQDGVVMIVAGMFLYLIMVIQMSAYMFGPMYKEFLNYLPQAGQNAFAIAPLLGCIYFAFSYYLNQGQTYGMFKNKKKVHFHSFTWKNLFKWSVISSAAGMSFGVPLLFPRFVTWAEQKCSASFRPHDDLYHELFIPKNEWAPVLAEMIPHELPVKVQEDNDHYHSNAA